MMLNTKLSYLPFRHFPLLPTRLHKINFVSHQYYTDFLIVQFPYSVQPFHNVVECVSLGYVEEEKSALGFAVVGGGDRLVLLGAGWVRGGVHVSQIWAFISLLRCGIRMFLVAY